MYLNDIDSTINGVSYIGNPKSGTAMFVAKKVEYLIEHLYNVDNCLVFSDCAITVPEELQKKHEFFFSEHPQADYALFVQKLSQKINDYNRKRKYTLAQEGYYFGENVHIGDNAYIEPGCLIGHDVTIGDNATILANAVIKNAVIGNNFTVGEGTVIGSEGFTLTKDIQGNWIHIPTLGKVRIGNYVDIGVHDDISRGTAGDTVLDDYIKLDAFVYIGHDAHLMKDTEITAGGIIGGYVVAEEKTCIGINATVRNRITIGEGCMIGMGAVVTKSVDQGMTVVGNPAREFKKTKE